MRFEDVAIAFDHPVLEGISFQLPRGETKILMGAAGTGKTLILKLALGLLKPDSGRITVLGDEITQMREEDLFELRRKIGMVFQESALFDSLTVEENVAYRLIEETGKLTDEIHARVLEALRFVELEHTVNLFPVGTFRRHAAPRGHRARHHHPAGGAALRFAHRRPRSGDLQHDHRADREAARRLSDQFPAGDASAAGRLHHGQPLFRSRAEQDGAGRRRRVRDLHTRFLILRDGKIIFEGTAAELLRCNDPYIREYLS